LRRCLDIEPDLGSVFQSSVIQVGETPGDFFLLGGLVGQLQLTAGKCILFQNDGLKSAQRQNLSGGKAGRSGADNRNHSFGPVYQRFGRLAFAAKVGIDGAFKRLVFRGIGQKGFKAPQTTDAAFDVLLAPLTDLFRPRRIGQVRTPQANEILEAKALVFCLEYSQATADGATTDGTKPVLANFSAAGTSLKKNFQ
jgi:hypothetical protein